MGKRGSEVVDRVTRKSSRNANATPSAPQDVDDLVDDLYAEKEKERQVGGQK